MFQFLRNFSLPYALAVFFVAAVSLAVTSQALNTGMDISATAWADGDPFTFENVVEEARFLAAGAYKEPEKVSPELLAIGYDAWRDIRFRPEKALWSDLKIPFALQFFHSGFYYDRTVGVCEIVGGSPLPVALNKEMFDYGRSSGISAGLPERISPAGFRVHGPINTGSYYDEYLVFLGASYFRAVPKAGRYGLSARGLAVDTAMPDGEEFPWFRHFWIKRPERGEKALVVYALLDSPSLAGAFEFVTEPGKETVMDVKARLFFRRSVAKLGVAPLTSMYFYGEKPAPMAKRDYRPEVHDSDGLLVAFANGEKLWRPLKNPKTLQISEIQAQGVSGFGLLQRDTDFNNYQDLEARYDLRPSVWVEPKGGWGPGKVELVEIPTDQEIHDNIVAYFVPAQSPGPGDELALEYRLAWRLPEAARAGWGAVTASRSHEDDGGLLRTFIIDFEGGRLPGLAAGAQVEGVVSVGRGARIVEQQVFKNDVTGGWRLVFRLSLNEVSTLERVLSDKKAPLEMRAFLRHGDDVLTETWSYAVEL